MLITTLFLLFVAVPAGIGLSAWIRKAVASHSIYREADRFARVALNNRFWRMLAGKEELIAGPIGELVGYLQKFLPQVIKKNAQARPSSELLTLWADHLSILVSQAAYKNNYLDSSLCGRFSYLTELEHYSPGLIGEGPNFLLPSVSVYSLKNYMNISCGEPRIGLVADLNPIIQQLHSFAVNGLGAVLIEAPVAPIAFMEQTPRNKWPKALNYWKSLNEGNLALEIEQARAAIQGLYLFKDDAAIAKLIERLEVLITQSEKRQNLQVTMQEAVRESNNALLEIQKEKAVQTALEATENLISAVTTKQKPAQEVTSMTIHTHRT